MDVATVSKLITSSQPKHRFWRGPTLALLGLSLLVGALWAAPQSPPGVFGWLLPQLLVVGVIVTIHHGTVRQRRADQLLQQAIEAVQLQQWADAETAITQLLASAVRQQLARTQALLGLVAIAQARHAYEAAQHVCRYILDHGLGSVLQQHTAQVSLAASLLRTDQITDAVNLIDRLSKQDLPPQLRAQVELLSLFREVTMGHTETSLETADERAELFRKHLGTRAAYGYGLLAAAFDRTGQPQTARHHWHNATLLVPPARLVDRFPELQTISQQYPAAEYPL